VRIIAQILGVLSFYHAQSQLLQQPIGEWREHLPYNSTIAVAAGDGKIFAATPYSVFSVTLGDRHIERMSRITGLSETGISTLAFDENNNKLVIAYGNSNLDIIHRADVHNIPDIKRDNVSGDKNIYGIYSLNGNYFLSTGLGVIVIDGTKYEVKDSWIIGANGNPVRINGFSSDASYYYAATEQGMKRSAVNSPNPADYLNWQLLSGSNGLSPGACQQVITVQGRIIVQKNDSLFVLNGNNWSLFYTDAWPFTGVSVSSDKIHVCERLNDNGRVVILNPDGTLSRIISQVAPVSFPRKAITYQNDPWIADQFGGLSHFTGSAYEVYKPNSPESVASGEMAAYNGVLYATAGEVNDSWIYQYNGNGIFVFREGTWNNINRYRYSAIDSLLDYITIAIDKRDETIWTGSYGGGLLHVKAGPGFEVFKQGYLDPAIGDPASYRVSGLAFDRDNDLWISNYGGVQPLRVRKNDGTWKSFSLPFQISENALGQIIVDDNNYKWIIAPKGNGLICYDHGSSIDATADDRWKYYRSGAGNGNLPSSDVLCIGKDKNGFVWVGTGDGIAVFQCPQRVFAPQGCEAVLPVVQQGNFAGYLFKGEEVQSIAVDGADRKWVGTKNGAWLIDPLGEKIIYRFTEENSPLLSNQVKKITIDGNTGEVYFATLKGICSFRSTATEGGPENENVLVFPNPVPPGYAGTIAIRGLANNSFVKITELDGRLIYQTRALGGQAIWNGKNYNGQRISSGVYLVLISDDGRTEKLATRIVFISR
jgi:hypothetical protein